MKLKSLLFSVAIILISNNVYSANLNQIVDSSPQSIAQLNEELRKLNAATNDLETDVDSISVIPAGIIVMWSGAIEDIPDGWALCDGENGTPDLTDKFVIHADADSGGTNDVGDTGGDNSQSITLNASNIPSLSLKLQTLQPIAGGSNVDYPDTTFTSTNTGSLSTVEANWVDASDEYRISSSTSGDAFSVDTRPEFYALAFIQKL